MIEKLRIEIIKAIEAYCAESIMQESTLRILSRPGFALHPESKCRTGLLTLEVYQAIRGTVNTVAFHAAVATELYMEASYIFDHLADNERDLLDGISSAEELTLAIELMSCGATAACEAARQSANIERGLSSVLQLHRDCIASCSGQFMDAHVQKTGLITTDEALRITCLKSGSLGKLAIAFAANIATDDIQIVKLFEEFGASLLTYMQLVDDIRDACPENTLNTDLGQHKQTLPLVYFNNYLAKNTTSTNGAIISLNSGEPVNQKVRQAYKASGAEIFSAIIAETFLNRVKSSLAALRNRAMMVDGLELLVSSVEFNPNEIFAVY